MLLWEVIRLKLFETENHKIQLSNLSILIMQEKINTKNKRFECVDIAKGIGILLVVWFHFPILKGLTYFEEWGGWITTFYMALFFMLSGLFFKPQALLTKVKRLMVPYLYFYFIAWIFYMLVCWVKKESVDWLRFFVPFWGGTQNYENTPIWFLFVLAQITCIFYVIRKKITNVYVVFCISMLISIGGYVLGLTMPVPYYIDVAMLCVAFFAIGNVLIDRILNINIYIGLIAGILSISCYILFPGFSNVSQNFEPMGYIPFLIISLGASLFVIWLSKIISGTIIGRILAFFGENSLIIMCTHIMLMSLPAVIGRHISNIWVANLIGIVVVMLIEIFVIFFINGYVKFLICKK